MNSTISPGPGAYVSKSFAFEINRPRFFMGIKLEPLKKAVDVPGAGTYDPNLSQTKYSSPAFKIGVKLSNNMFKKSLSPGPGAYDLRFSNKKQSP